MNHIVALSGGKDSTVMSIRLKEVEPRPYTYICTPTRRELPEMIEHWERLEVILGQPIIRVYAPTTLGEQIDIFKMLPSHHARWCTRILKIKPYQDWLKDKVPATSYVGLRADEERLGVVYDETEGVIQDYPFKRWGWGIKEVLGYLRERGITIPRRSDCDLCYDQRLSEWYELWRQHPDKWAEGEAWEAKTGHTFRSPSRDTWPAALTELRAKFESGMVPRGVKLQGEMFEPEYERCRVCTL